MASKPLSFPVSFQEFLKLQESESLPRMLSRTDYGTAGGEDFYRVLFPNGKIYGYSVNAGLRDRIDAARGGVQANLIKQLGTQVHAETGQPLEKPKKPTQAMLPGFESLVEVYGGRWEGWITDSGKFVPLEGGTHAMVAYDELVGTGLFEPPADRTPQEQEYDALNEALRRGWVLIGGDFYKEAGEIEVGVAEFDLPRLRKAQKYIADSVPKAQTVFVGEQDIAASLTSKAYRIPLDRFLRLRGLATLGRWQVSPGSIGVVDGSFESLMAKQPSQAMLPGFESLVEVAYGDRSPNGWLLPDDTFSGGESHEDPASTGMIKAHPELAAIAGLPYDDWLAALPAELRDYVNKDDERLDAINWAYDQGWIRIFSPIFIGGGKETVGGYAVQELFFDTYFERIQRFFRDNVRLTKRNADLPFYIDVVLPGDLITSSYSIPYKQYFRAKSPADLGAPIRGKSFESLVDSVHPHIQPAKPKGSPDVVHVYVPDAQVEAIMAEMEPLALEYGAVQVDVGHGFKNTKHLLFRFPPASEGKRLFAIALDTFLGGKRRITTVESFESMVEADWNSKDFFVGGGWLLPDGQWLPASGHHNATAAEWIMKNVDPDFFADLAGEEAIYEYAEDYARAHGWVRFVNSYTAEFIVTPDRKTFIRTLSRLANQPPTTDEVYIEHGGSLYTVPVSMLGKIRAIGGLRKYRQESAVSSTKRLLEMSDKDQDREANDMLQKYRNEPTNIWLYTDLPISDRMIWAYRAADELKHVPESQDLLAKFVAALKICVNDPDTFWEQVAETTPVRADYLKALDWKLEKVPFKDIGVYPKFSGFSDEICRGSLEDTASKIRDTAEKPLKRKKLMKMSDMWQTIAHFLPPILVKGGTVRGRHDDYTQTKYDIDDGNHRLVAAALGGATEAVCFVGNETTKSKKDTETEAVESFAQLLEAEGPGIKGWAYQGYIDDWKVTAAGQPYHGDPPLEDDEPHVAFTVMPPYLEIYQQDEPVSLSSPIIGDVIDEYGDQVKQVNIFGGNVPWKGTPEDWREMAAGGSSVRGLIRGRIGVESEGLLPSFEQLLAERRIVTPAPLTSPVHGWILPDGTRLEGAEHSELVQAWLDENAPSEDYYTDEDLLDWALGQGWVRFATFYAIEAVHMNSTQLAKLQDIYSTYLPARKYKENQLYLFLGGRSYYVAYPDFLVAKSVANLKRYSVPEALESFEQLTEQEELTEHGRFHGWITPKGEVLIDPREEHEMLAVDWAEDNNPVLANWMEQQLGAGAAWDIIERLVRNSWVRLVALMSDLDAIDATKFTRKSWAALQNLITPLRADTPVEFMGRRTNIGEIQTARRARDVVGESSKLREQEGQGYRVEFSVPYLENDPDKITSIMAEYGVQVLSVEQSVPKEPSTPEEFALRRLVTKYRRFKQQRGDIETDPRTWEVQAIVPFEPPDLVWDIQDVIQKRLGLKSWSIKGSIGEEPQDQEPVVSFESMLQVQEAKPKKDQIAAVAKALDWNPEYVLDAVKATDPDPGIKHGTWLLRQWKANNVDLGEQESVDKLRTELEKFDMAAKLGVLKGKERSLDDYPTAVNLIQRMAKIPDEELVSKTAAKRGIAPWQAMFGQEVAYQDESYTVLRMLRPETLSYHSKKGTSWCTYDTRAAKRYLGDGPFYVVYSGGMPALAVQIDKGGPVTMYNPEDEEVSAQYVEDQLPGVIGILQGIEPDYEDAIEGARGTSGRDPYEDDELAMQLQEEFWNSEATSFWTAVDDAIDKLPEGPKYDAMLDDWVQIDADTPADDVSAGRKLQDLFWKLAQSTEAEWDYEQYGQDQWSAWTGIENLVADLHLNAQDLRYAADPRREEWDREAEKAQLKLFPTEPTTYWQSFDIGDPVIVTQRDGTTARGVIEDEGYRSQPYGPPDSYLVRLDSGLRAVYDRTAIASAEGIASFESLMHEDEEPPSYAAEDPGRQRTEAWRRELLARQAAWIEILNREGLEGASGRRAAEQIKIISDELKQLRKALGSMPEPSKYTYPEPRDEPGDLIRSFESLVADQLLEAPQPEQIASVAKKLMPSAWKNDPERARDAITKLGKAADPDPNWKHGPWILKQWKLGNVLLHAAGVQERVYDALQKFDAAVTTGALKGEAADLRRYKKIDDLETALRALPRSAFVSKRAIKKGKGDPGEVPGSELVAQSENFKIYKVTTVEAAGFHGEHTQWCTADPRWAKEYLETGPLYVVWKSTGKSWEPILQATQDGSMVMDVNDEEVGAWWFAINDPEHELLNLLGQTEFSSPYTLDAMRGEIDQLIEISKYADEEGRIDVDDLVKGDALMKVATDVAFIEQFGRPYQRTGSREADAIVDVREEHAGSEVLTALAEIAAGEWQPARENYDEIATDYQTQAEEYLYGEMRAGIRGKLAAWLDEGEITEEQFDALNAALDHDDLPWDLVIELIQQAEEAGARWTYDVDGAWFSEDAENLLDMLTPQQLGQHLGIWKEYTGMTPEAAGQQQLLPAESFESLMQEQVPAFIRQPPGWKDPVLELVTNPSPKDIVRLDGPKWGLVHGFLVGDDLVVWVESMHYIVRRGAGLPETAVPLTIYHHRGIIQHVEVTDTTRNTPWWHNPDLADFIRGHPRMPDDVGISYYDEHIVGDWAELEPESDETFEALVTRAQAARSDWKAFELNNQAKRKRKKTKKKEAIAPDQKQLVFEKAKQIFGVTQNAATAGYILPDGSMLDLSREDTERSISHSEIDRVFNDLGITTELFGLDEFLNMGAIRWVPEIWGFESAVEPTTAQYHMLEHLAAQRDGEIFVDIYVGDERNHREFDAGTSPAEIVDWVRRLYRGGIETEGLDLDNPGFVAVVTASQLEPSCV